jgi:hypothetical protein
MENIELLESVVIDAFWSPLEPSKGRLGVPQAPAYSSSRTTKTITIDVMTRKSEPDDSFAGVRRRKPTGQEGIRSQSRSRGGHLSTCRPMQNFARGMASAFGASISSRPRTSGKKAYLNDFDLGESKAAKSFLLGFLPSGTRIRLLFSRMGGKRSPLSLEQRPLASDYHESSSSSYAAMPATFRVRAY